MTFNSFELAKDLYERYAETLAVQYGQAERLPNWKHTSDTIKGYWGGIAAEMIRHSSKWLPNKGCAVSLAPDETERIKHGPPIACDSCSRRWLRHRPSETHCSTEQKKPMGYADYFKGSLLDFVKAIASGDHAGSCFPEGAEGCTCDVKEAQKLIASIKDDPPEVRACVLCGEEKDVQVRQWLSETRAWFHVHLCNWCHDRIQEVVTQKEPMPEHAELLKDARELANERDALSVIPGKVGLTAHTLRTLADLVERLDARLKQLADVNIAWTGIHDEDWKIRDELVAACKTCDEVITMFIGDRSVPLKDKRPSDEDWIKLDGARYLAQRGTTLGKPNEDTGMPSTLPELVEDTLFTFAALRTPGPLAVGAAELGKPEGDKHPTTTCTLCGNDRAHEWEWFTGRPGFPSVARTVLICNHCVTTMKLGRPPIHRKGDVDATEKLSQADPHDDRVQSLRRPTEPAPMVGGQGMPTPPGYTEFQDDPDGVVTAGQGLIDAECGEPPAPPDYAEFRDQVTLIIEKRIQDLPFGNQPSASLELGRCLDDVLRIPVGCAEPAPPVKSAIAEMMAECNRHVDSIRDLRTAAQTVVRAVDGNLPAPTVEVEMRVYMPSARWWVWECKLAGWWITILKTEDGRHCNAEKSAREFGETWLTALGTQLGVRLVAVWKEGK